MQNTQQYSAQRPAGHEHIPVYPKGFIAIRLVQLVLAIIILGLCAFGAYVLPTSGNCLMLFVSVATIIETIWLIVAHYGMPKAYNYWAVLALDIFLVVFWLCGFGLLASEAAYLFVIDSYYYYSSTSIVILSSCMSAAAGVGGLQFVLFITSLSIHGVMLHRHRKAGLHCNPVSSGIAPVTTTTHIENDKSNAHMSVNPAYQPVNQGQAAPPYAQQNQQPYDAGVPQHQQQAQQQMYAPAPAQQFQQQPQQMQPQPQQQQNFFPQPSPTPLSAQNTGGSFMQMPPQQAAAPPMPNAHEVSGNMYHQN
ncbi:integral membrane protein [Colletotrichum musicola]|uniref:Integral membrane protein n=1 Tax=Colletotrichum musicola TaxID=2175873 RepID=A0A8H6NDC2_9PEZI|nr:integral membrane protein [Colletotrichum musicola]